MGACPWDPPNVLWCVPSPPTAPLAGGGIFLEAQKLVQLAEAALSMMLGRPRPAGQSTRRAWCGLVRVGRGGRGARNRPLLKRGLWESGGLVNNVHTPGLKGVGQGRPGLREGPGSAPSVSSAAARPQPPHRCLFHCHLRAQKWPGEKGEGQSWVGRQPTYLNFEF